MAHDDELDIAAPSGRIHAQRWGSPAAPLVVGVPGLAGNIKSFAFLGERLGGDDALTAQLGQALVEGGEPGDVAEHERGVEGDRGLSGRDQRQQVPTDEWLERIQHVTGLSRV